MVLLHRLPNLSDRFVFLRLLRIIKSALFLEVKISLLVLVHELKGAEAFLLVEGFVVEALAELILISQVIVISIVVGPTLRVVKHA